MANSTEQHWDETSPSLSQSRRAGAAEITSLRAGVRLRVSREHETLTTSGAGGEHKPGSAKCYSDSTDPVNRPDGSTILDTNDKGRLWYEPATGRIRVWDGSAWIAINVPTSSFFTQENTNPSFGLPFTKSGLSAGTWLVHATGVLSPLTNSASVSISMTINGVTRTLALTQSGNLDTVLRSTVVSIPFIVTVTGAGTITVSASSGCNVQGMVGVRVGW